MVNGIGHVFIHPHSVFGDKWACIQLHVPLCVHSPDQVGHYPQPMYDRGGPDFLVGGIVCLWPERKILIAACLYADGHLPHHFPGRTAYCWA